MVKVYNSYTSLFIFNNELSDCNFYAFEMRIKNIGIEDTNVNNINILLNNQSLGEFPLINEEFLFSFIGNVGEHTFTITENNDLQTVLYQKKFKFTDINYPLYPFYPYFIINLSGLYCDLSISQLKIDLQDENNVKKNVDCNNGNLDSNLNIIKCSIQDNFNQKFGYHNLIINDYFLNTIYISKNLNDVEFQFTNNYFSFSIIDQSKSFYMNAIEKIKVLLNNDIVYYTSENFTINNYEITFNTGTYKIDVIYIKIYQEEWETDSLDENLYKINDLILFYDYLYKVNTNFILIDKDNKEKEEYPIELEFEDLNHSRHYKDSFINLECEEPINEYLICIITEELTEPGEIRIKLGDFESNINTIKYVFYEIIGEKCQTIIGSNEVITVNFNISKKCSIEFRDGDHSLSSISQSEENEIVMTSFVIQNHTEGYNDFEFLYDCKNEDEDDERLSTRNNLGITFYNIFKFIESKEKAFVEKDIPELNIIYDSNEDISKFAFTYFYLTKNNSNLNFTSNNFQFKENYILNIKFDFNMEKNENYYLSYIDNCKKEITTDIIISCIEFKSKRKYYIINNKINDINDNYGIIQGRIENLIVFKYIVNQNYNETLIEIGNGDYKFAINEKGTYYFNFKNYHDEEQFHNIETEVTVYNKFNDIINIESDIHSSYYLFDSDQTYFNYEVKFSVKEDIVIDNFTLILKREECISNACYHYLNLSDGLISYEGNIIAGQYQLLIIEGDDVYTPIYGVDVTFIDIKLESPNEKFIYNNAPYINFRMSYFVNIDFDLSFELNNINHTITCLDISYYENEIFKCYLDSSFQNFDAGYYKLYVNDFLISDNIFISKSIESASFNIIVPQSLFIGINKFEIYSNDFFLEELESYYINTNYSNPLTEKKLFGEFIEDKDNYLNNKIVVTFNLEKNITTYIYKIQRRQIEYDNESSILYQIISNDESSIVLEVNVLDFYFIFDKLYIILNSGSELNYNSSFQKLNITPVKNGDSKLDTLESVYLKSINNTELNYNLNKIDDSYIYEIPDNENNTGYYQFIYKYIGRDVEYPINEKVFVVNSFDEIFLFSNQYECIINNFYNPIIMKNTSYEYFEYINMKEISLLLIDNINSHTYNYELIEEFGNSYQLNINLDNLNSINMEGRFNLVVIEHNNFEFYIKSYDIDIYSIELTNDKYFKDNIIIKGVYCDLKGLEIENDLGETYNLECKKRGNNPDYISCEALNLNFINQIYDTFHLLYFGKKMFDKDSTNIKFQIYNSINDATFNMKIPEIILDDTTTNIIIESNNFNLMEIESVELKNIYTEEIIICKINSTNCMLIINDESIIISSFLNHEYSYSVTIYRKIYEYDNINEVIISQILDKLIVSRFVFNLDKTILILSTYNYNGTLILKASGSEKDLIENVYYKISGLNEFDDDKILMKLNDDEYKLNSISIPGKYEFAFSYKNSAYTYNKININIKIYGEVKEVFHQINYDTKCILFGQPFLINITLTNEINIQYSIRLFNKNEYLELIYDSSEKIYSTLPTLEENYTLEIYEIYNKDNILFKLDNVSISKFNINNFYSYKDYIELFNVKCNFDILGISPFLSSSLTIIPLTCVNNLNEKIICKVSNNILYYGDYSIYFRQYNTEKKIFISNSLTNSLFSIIKPKQNDIINEGTILITISNIKNDFYMPFLSHVLIKSDKNETEDMIINLNIENNNNNYFSFKIYVKESNTYNFYLYRKDMYENENEYYKYILLDNRINVQDSSFEINDNIGIINKSIKTLENVTFDLTFKKGVITKTTIKEILINSIPNNKNCLIKSNTITTCYYIPKIKEPTILTISFRFWTKYYYIFTYESFGSFCENKNLGEIIFNLEISKYFTHQINFGYNSLTNKLECGNYTDDSFNVFSCKVDVHSYSSNTKIIVSTLNINKNIPLQPSEIFTDIISISGKLYEGSLSQQLKIIFKNNILKDEITKCTLININDNLQNVTSIPTISSKNQKQAILNFNLYNIQYGTYNLICENKCFQKAIYENIKIDRIKCSEPLIRFVSNENNPSCKHCNETSNINVFYENGHCVKECNKSINYAVKAKEVHWCGFCYETDIRNNIEYCVDNCAKGTIEYEGNCY